MSKRTITLTGRPPVSIEDEAWPIIAQASYHDFDNQYDFQANRHWKGSVRVRQHEDGRVIVYAVCTYASQFQNESGYQQKAGELLGVGATTEQITAAIHRVHGTIDGDEGGRPLQWKLLAEECIADLPAEELV